MNNVSTNVQNPVTRGTDPDIMKKLLWSLALAAVPIIPDILETIRSIPDQMARNGYALHVKHGQTEVHFNRADIVGDAMKGDDNDGQNS